MLISLLVNAALLLTQPRTEVAAALLLEDLDHIAHVDRQVLGPLASRLVLVRHTEALPDEHGTCVGQYSLSRLLAE